MLRKANCKHCKMLFQPIRQGHLYCSDNCRKLQHKAKNRVKNQAKNHRRLETKIQKLSNSNFGKYLVRELRRVGTVQVLYGNTSDTLGELVSLRHRCTIASGYQDGTPLNTYEISHIQPAYDPESLGLLIPKNLTIAPDEFNRKHATKKPISGYMGESLPTDRLLPEWRVPNKAVALDVLKLARKFLGQDFDKWLSAIVIPQTQSQVLIKGLKKKGLPEKILANLSLNKLKALAKEEDLSYFDISKPPEELRDVLIEELERLQLEPTLLEAMKYSQEQDWSLDEPSTEFTGTPSERKSLEEFLTSQALACLHGQPYKTEYKNNFILRYFKQKPKEVFSSRDMGWESDEIL